MSVTEVSSQGWFSRIGESIKGVLFGILLFIVAFPLLFWNEGRAVHRAQVLSAGKSQVVSVTAGSVDAANEGKLVHLSGAASAEGTLKDPLFGIKAPKALRLQRSTEMFQWKENKSSKKQKKLGGGEETVTTYSYEQVWSDDILNSSGFKEANHNNPQKKPYDTETWDAPDAKVGAFQLGELTKQIDSWENLPVTEPSKLPVKVEGGIYYAGANPQSPAIGDTRIEFKTVQPTEVSLVAVQQGGGFAPFKTKADSSDIFRLTVGQHTADEMFQQMEQENAIMTWVLRGVGFFVMVLGIVLVFRPLSVVADVVPLFGSLLEAGLGFIAFALAIPLTLVTIGVAWIFYRPLLGIALLLIAGGIIAFAYKTAQAKKAT